jgi:hypothetical protein
MQRCSTVVSDPFAGPERCAGFLEVVSCNDGDHGRVGVGAALLSEPAIRLASQGERATRQGGSCAYRWFSGGECRM